MSTRLILGMNYYFPPTKFTEKLALELRGDGGKMDSRKKLELVKEWKVRMKSFFQKVLRSSVVLAVLIVTLSVGSRAVAATTEVTSEEELKAALAEGGEIKLNDNFTVSGEDLTVDKDGTILDLNGKTLTFDDKKLIITADVKIKDGGEGGLITNSSRCGDELSEVLNTRGVLTAYQRSCQSTGIVSVEGGHLEWESGKATAVDWPAKNNDKSVRGNTTAAVEVVNGSLNITGGEFQSNSLKPAVVVTNGLLEVNGGSFVGSDSQYAIKGEIKTEITVNNGAVAGGKGINAYGKLTVNGGNINTSGTAIYMSYNNSEPVANFEDDRLIINAGEISSNKERVIYLYGGSGSGKQIKASINGGKISDMNDNPTADEAAIFASYSDITVNRGEVLGNNAYAISANRYVIVGNNDTEIGDLLVKSDQKTAIKLNSSNYRVAKVVVNGGTVESHGPQSDGFGIYIDTSNSTGAYDASEVNGGVVKSQNSAAVGLFGYNSLYISGGALEGKYFAVSNNGSDKSSGCAYYQKEHDGGVPELKISGGNLLATDGPAIYVPQACFATEISGGTVTGTTGVEIRGGSLAISDSAKIVSTGDTLATKANGNGSTTDQGAAIVVTPHTTEMGIDLTIDGGELDACVPVFVANPQRNAKAADPIRATAGKAPNNYDATYYRGLENVKVNISGGKFNNICTGDSESMGLILADYVEDETDFGGNYFTSNVTMPEGYYKVKAYQAYDDPEFTEKYFWLTKNEVSDKLTLVFSHGKIEQANFADGIDVNEIVKSVDALGLDDLKIKAENIVPSTVSSVVRSGGVTSVVYVDDTSLEDIINSIFKDAEASISGKIAVPAGDSTAEVEYSLQVVDGKVESAQVAAGTTIEQAVAFHDLLVKANHDVDVSVSGAADGLTFEIVKLVQDDTQDGNEGTICTDGDYCTTFSDWYEAEKTLVAVNAGTASYEKVKSLVQPASESSADYYALVRHIPSNSLADAHSSAWQQLWGQLVRQANADTSSMGYYMVQVTGVNVNLIGMNAASVNIVASAIVDDMTVRLLVVNEIGDDGSITQIIESELTAAGAAEVLASLADIREKSTATNYKVTGNNFTFVVSKAASTGEVTSSLEATLQTDMTDHLATVINALNTYADEMWTGHVTGSDYAIAIAQGKVSAVNFTSATTREQVEAAIAGTEGQFMVAFGSVTMMAVDGKLFDLIPLTPAGTSDPNDRHASGEHVPNEAKAQGCDAVTPVGQPDLFQIDRQGDKVTLYFTPVRDFTDRYHVLFGYGDGDERFGGVALQVSREQNNGVLAVDVSNLDLAQAYAFKVAPVNNCATGEWSNWLSVPAASRYGMGTIKTYRYGSTQLPAAKSTMANNVKVIEKTSNAGTNTVGIEQTVRESRDTIPSATSGTQTNSLRQSKKSR